MKTKAIQNYLRAFMKTLNIESEAVNRIALEQEKEWLIQATADLLDGTG